MADSESWDDNIPVAQPWPESKPSPPSAEDEEEEEEDDDNIDTQLKANLQNHKADQNESDEGWDVAKELERFVASKTDPSLFIYHHGAITTYVLVYVDDIIVTSSKAAHVTPLLQQLAMSFSIKDLGPLSFFLGVKVVRIAGGILLSQSCYITDLLQRASMADCKLILTPMATTTRLFATGGGPMKDPTRYRMIVKALQYITLTRPNVAYSVNQACQFMHAPTEHHCTHVKRILRYLKHTKSYGLFINRSTDIALQAFTNANWADNGDDCKSTGGYAVSGTQSHFMDL
ncbi:uncharacterized mitochondrial protein AtMg00810-like [Telopea speciosissima]|uniref:uncharacterized mitochondrial protein AtMg00810-like n=1 Tax=Telopea speciosissima TaxID=54955 RepID=UPI001CC6D29F|nr:uncharacterized mitochondrial protein AtMg00810-like [Telopea speciosissima]